MLPVDLILGDNDLAGVDVASVANGVTQDADDSDHLTHFGGAIHSITGVTDQLLAPGDLWWANMVKGLIPGGEVYVNGQTCLSLQDCKRKVYFIKSNSL